MFNTVSLTSSFVYFLSDSVDKPCALANQINLRSQTSGVHPPLSPLLSSDIPTANNQTSNPSETRKV